jgi:hypothetical protein
LPWLESLATKATAMATQAPEACGQPVGSAYRLMARKSSLVEAAPGWPSRMPRSPPGGRPRAGSWSVLLALQQPHVGSLGAFLTLGDVELDNLPLVK